MNKFAFCVCQAYYAGFIKALYFDVRLDDLNLGDLVRCNDA
jgi:hypothetical protein